MTVSLTNEKINKLREIAQLVLSHLSMTIRVVAKLVVHMVSCFPGVEFGEPYYRQTEIEKPTALKLAKGNFDATMTLSDNAISDIQWWTSYAHLSKKAIDNGRIDVVMTTDASVGVGCQQRTNLCWWTIGG